MDTVEVRRLLETLPLANMFDSDSPATALTSSAEASTGDTEEGGGTAWQDSAGCSFREERSVHLDAALVDLMGRYGRVATELFFDSGRGYQPAEAEAAGRELADRYAWGDPRQEDAPQLGNSLQQVLVRLIVERARGIGKMDLGRGADLFCVAFVGDWSPACGRPVTVPGNRLFQTKVRRGRSEDDWTWNEVCACQFAPILAITLRFPCHYFSSNPARHSNHESLCHCPPTGTRRQHQR
jgi:hypothetical protein